MATVDRSLSQPLFPVARSAGASPSAHQAGDRNRVRDLAALVLLAGCAFLAVALATFSAGDPPLPRTFPPNAQPANACGLLGSIVAGGLYEAFGLGAWGVLALLLTADIALLRRHSLPDLPLRTAGGVIAIAAGCTLLALFLPDWVARPLWCA